MNYLNGKIFGEVFLAKENYVVSITISFQIIQ